MFNRILLFGYGSMASAMLEGWLAAGNEPARFTVYNPRPKPVPAGVTLTTSPPQAVFDAILLGVKPQKLDEVASEVEPLAGPETTLISMLAGVELATLAARFPRAGAVVRLIPNLAAALGKSASVLVASGLNHGQRAVVTALAQHLGAVEWLDDESEADLVTALTASGPAFVYRFIDAMAAGAAGLGLDGAQAERLALRTVEGAAALAAIGDAPPAELAHRVASPGGMTRKGLDVLDAEDALERLVTRCLAAARDRSRELGRLPET